MSVALSSAELEFLAVAFCVLCCATVAVVLSWVSTAVAVVVLVAVVLLFVSADGIESSLMADALALTLLADDTFMAVVALPETLVSFFPASVVELSSVAIPILVPLLLVL